VTVIAIAAAVAEANASQKAAPAEWLGQVSEPVRGVMSALQQMASVAVQANEQRDSSHARLVQSMTPDALLACGMSLYSCAVCMMIHMHVADHMPFSHPASQKA